MNVEIDYNPSPKKCFFISVGINEKEAISFDYTIKGHRIIKQVLVEKKPFPADKKPTSEWDALIIEEGKFKKRYHVRWIDLDNKDWVNNEIWETVWINPISPSLAKKLLHYSQLFCDNYKELGLPALKKEWNEFEVLLKKEISKHLKR